MQQNIRVDVIYYLSPSDFEMEFNLCGCCHMRLLNEKTQDRQTLVKALAKAVSRSKVIIMCGPLFDDNGLINTVSTAIGKQTEVINNSDYGINYDDEIRIIEGGTPLVTPEGFFGGCIIESGPQAIIVLSESKGIRKSIMNNLVHQYIYELSLLPEDALTGNQVVNEQETEEVSEEVTPELLEGEAEQTLEENAEEITEEGAEETVEQTEEITEFEDISSSSESETEPQETEIEEEETVEENEAEEVKEEATEQEETPVVEEDKSQEEPKESTPEPFPVIEMYIDPQHVSPKKVSDYAKNYVPSEKDSLFISEDEYDYDIDDDDGGSFITLPKIKLSIVLLVIVLSLIAVVLIYLMVYIPYSKGIDFSTYVEQIFGPASNI